MKFVIYLIIVQIINSFQDVRVDSVEAPSVYVPGNGIILGTYLKMFRTQNIKAYLGIRYAEASRFTPPDVDVPAWSGIFNATTFAPDCWQQPIKSDEQTETVINLLSGKRYKGENGNKYEENCLHLNVYVPDGSPSNNGYAVIVWIHSGDFSQGSAKNVEPFQLVFKQKVIVVTFSYRLNIFGFFSTDDGEAQGNYGLMDQSAALFWIKKNINYFGGDERRVTLMGHGAGAVSVGLHLTSGEWSKGAFNRAIMMSGNPMMQNSIKRPKDFGNGVDMISNIFGCTRRPTSMLIQCLKRVDASIISQNLPSIEWGPVIDYGLSNISYPFVENYPEILLEKGNFHKVPVILGVTDMEEVLSLFGDNVNEVTTSNDFTSYINDIALNDIQRVVGKSDDWCTNYEIVSDAINYIYSVNNSDLNDNNKKLITVHTERTYLAPLLSLASILSKYEKVFLYLSTIRPKTQFYKLPAWITVPKYFDQIFVWGVPYMSNTDIVPEWNSTDKKLSDIVMTLWSNFAKTANPTVSNVYVKWSPINRTDVTSLLINDNFDVHPILNNYRIGFWNDYYPKILQFSIDCCNSTNSASFFDTDFLFYYGVYSVIHYVIKMLVCY